MGLKKIRIFIGSSIEDLALERSELMRFLGGLNNRYVDRGVYFEGYVCEETPGMLAEGGSQRVHDDYIRDSADAAIFLFFRKAGEFTLREMELARSVFLAEKRPEMFIFFKAVGDAPAPLEEIKKCVRHVAEDYGHYYKLFDSADTVKLELLEYLVEKLHDGSELAVRDGKAILNGEALSGDMLRLENVFAYRNNPSLRKLREEEKDLLERMAEASRRGDTGEVLKLSKRLGEAQETARGLEKDILGMLRQFREENRKGKKADPRRMEALRLLELGRVEEAKALIPQEELSREAELQLERWSAAESALAEEAEELLENARVRIRALELDATDPHRFTAIEAVYDSVLELAVKAKGYGFIYDYASFLYDQKQYPKGIGVAERLRYLYGDPAAAVPERDRAELLTLLGMLYSDNNDLRRSEEAYTEALRIVRQLAGTDPKTYMPDVATSCNNLGNLYADTGRPGEAEKLYLEALGLRRELMETVSRAAYMPDVAASCNNLGILYADTGRPEEAEKLYLEGLGLYRELMERESRTDYMPYVATSCNNLGNLYKQTGQPDEAEKLHLEALELYRELMERVSRAAYMPAVAASCNNLGALYADTGRPDEAEKLYLEALELYRELMERVSREAYMPAAATSCRNLGILYADTGRPDEAEKLYLEALELRRELMETVSRTAYGPDAAVSYGNLGLLYVETGRPAEAEKLFREALTLAREFRETNGACRRICDALEKFL